MKVKKMYKKILLISLILFSICNTYIFAVLGNGFNDELYNEVANEENTDLDVIISRIGSTILLVLQVVAVCGVVFTGVKYMYAASNDKAKIKETLIWLIIGTILVFSAPAVIDFIINISNNVISKN